MKCKYCGNELQERNRSVRFAGLLQAKNFQGPARHHPARAAREHRTLCQPPVRRRLHRRRKSHRGS